MVIINGQIGTLIRNVQLVMLISNIHIGNELLTDTLIK